MGRNRVSRDWKDAVVATHRAEAKCKRLVKAIAGDIESGTLAAVSRLAPQRKMAAELGVSVQTVTNAYQELERQGLIRCEVGRGSFVALRVKKAMPDSNFDAPERQFIDFSTVQIVHTPEHDVAWREVCATLASLNDQPWIRSCGPIAGLAHHRQAGVEWLASLNMPAKPDSLLITNGAAHGVFLALASIAGPGDTVLCESLTSPFVIGAAKIRGFTLKGLAIDGEGIRPDRFEEICRIERVSTPTFSMPTVSLMSASRRREIARIAERYGVRVVENDVYGALLTEAATPIASLLPELGFYSTSMTKSVLTGLRTGYLAVPRRYTLRVESMLRASTGGATSPIAEIAARWIADGTARRLVDLQRQRLTARQAMARAALNEHIIGAHDHALAVWLGVPGYWQTERLAAELHNRKIAVTTSNPFVAPGMPRPEALRLCVGAEVSDADCRAALEAVAQLFEQYPGVSDIN